MTIDTCPETPRVDPRVLRTRKLIEDAFRALLAERPYSEISVGDVTARATVHRATFYAHFEDKEHLATSMMRSDLDTALRARLAHRMPLNADTLSGVAEAIFEFFGRTAPHSDGYDELAPTLMATLQETIHSLVRRWLDLDPQAMRVFPGAQKEDVATVLSWSLYGGALRWSRVQRRPPAAEAARQIVALLVR